MTKLVAFALLAAAFSAPAIAAPSSDTSFTRDGATYYVTTADMGRYTRISGHDTLGRTFDFRQTGTRVAGYFDQNYVEFAAPEIAKKVDMTTR